MISFFNKPVHGQDGMTLCGAYEQDGPSMGHLHVAAQTRESAPLLRSPALQAPARVGTSLCGIHEQDGPSVGRPHVAAQRRDSASLLRSPSHETRARVGTSLCQGWVIS